MESSIHTRVVIRQRTVWLMIATLYEYQQRGLCHSGQLSVNREYFEIHLMRHQFERYSANGRDNGVISSRSKSSVWSTVLLSVPMDVALAFEHESGTWLRSVPGGRSAKAPLALASTRKRMYVPGDKTSHCNALAEETFCDFRSRYPVGVGSTAATLSQKADYSSWALWAPPRLAKMFL
jgi:hypothetical protein